MTTSLRASLDTTLPTPAPPRHSGEDAPSQQHRTIWISDIHLGTAGCNWSLSQYLKHKAKTAVAFIADFEAALIKEARRRGFDGVVCGHIHKAEIRMIDGMLYCNDGDWVESLTALVEDHAGRLEIVECKTIRPTLPALVGEMA